MPDWRKDGDYAFTENLSPEGWAWEFLRRNPEYNSNYESVKTLVANEEKEFGPIPAGIWRLNKDIPHTVHFIPEKKPNESRMKWIHRCIAEDKEPRVLTHEGWIARKWRLKFWMPSPEENEPELYFFKQGRGAELLSWDDCSQYFYDVSGEEEQGVYEQVEESVVIVFDVMQAITPQLKQANKIIKGKKNDLKLPLSFKGQGKNKTDIKTLPTLLRIYDAWKDKLKPSPSEIADHLFPQEDNSLYAVSDKVTKRYKRAKQLVMKDYLQCLLMSDIQKK